MCMYRSQGAVCISTGRQWKHFRRRGLPPRNSACAHGSRCGRPDRRYPPALGKTIDHPSVMRSRFVFSIFTHSGTTRNFVLGKSARRSCGIFDRKRSGPGWPGRSRRAQPRKRHAWPGGAPAAPTPAHGQLPWRYRVFPRFERERPAAPRWRDAGRIRIRECCRDADQSALPAGAANLVAGVAAWPPGPISRGPRGGCDLGLLVQLEARASGNEVPEITFSLRPTR